ncbi:MAG TPA: bifunctional nuclease family protein [Crocinitomix sp.]|nr:bifunctional nuclease family protein [Crocinitomix sp.]
MEKIEIKIVGLSYSQTQSGAYALVLAEKKGKRRLPIIIGGFEAQSIAIELENMKPSRPLTHDLFKSFADAFKIKITEIVIYNLIEGVFYSKIVCEQDGKTIEIDARTSDAIAVGIRARCPIYTFENILSSAGIQLENEDIESGIEDEFIENKTKKEEELSLEELELRLKEAVENEEYELASKLRDEIKKRKEK